MLKFLKSVPLAGWLALALAALCLVACGNSEDPTPRALVRDCVTDSECGGQRCDPLKGCVECLFDTDCASEERCLYRRCEPVQHCDATTTCARGACDLVRQQCVDCLRDTDCTGTAHCVASACVPFTPCIQDSDCTTGHCDLTQAECAACLNDEHCGPGEACKKHQCRRRCATTADCSETAGYCDTQGLCAECLTNEDCPTVYHCSNESCVLDVCEGGPRCSSTADAIVNCNATGDALTRTPCGPGASCSTALSTASCRAPNCEPGVWKCDSTGRYADRCGTDGLSFNARIDCSENMQICDHGTCVARACVPGTLRCIADGISRCDSMGRAEVRFQTCGDNELCDPETFTCTVRACTPASLACAGEVIMQCDASGTAQSRVLDCAAAGKLCWEGACRERACETPYVCQGGNSFSCVNNATLLELANACTENGSYCDSATGQCQPLDCRPGEPMCNGELVTRCNDEGSGPVADGVDCAQTNQVCWQGTCRAVVCTEPFVCTEGDLYRCDEHGTTLTIAQKCDEGTVCDALMGSCRLQHCIPWAPACDGSVATSCDATGLGFEGPRTNCSDSALVCADGQCLPLICSPNSRYCEGDELRVCGTTGATYAVLDTCTPSEYCNASQPICLPDTCSASTPICDGSRATLCAQDGSGPTSGGEDCASSSRVCERGVCRALVCVPNQTFCESTEAVSLCNGRGTSAAPYAACKPGEHCEESATAAACTPNICTANKSACQGERVISCNDQGSGYALGAGTDCPAPTVCSLTGECLSLATDSLRASGAAPRSQPSSFHFAIFHAEFSRTLRTFALGFGLASDTPVSFLVYRGDDDLGPFTPLRETIAAVAASTPALQPSPALDVVLESGKYYLFGVGVPSAHEIVVGEDLTPAPQSFGELLGSFSYASPASNGTLVLPASIAIGIQEVEPNLWITLSSARP